MNKYIKLTFVLFFIAALSGLVIGGVNDLTKDTIAEIKYQKLVDGITAIYEDTADFEDLDLENSTSNNILAVYMAKDSSGKELGHVYKMVGPDAYSYIEFLVGIDAEGKVVSISFLDVKETPGLGSKVQEDEDFYSQFIEKDEVSTDNIDVITGASISSKAVINGVDIALKDYKANYLK